MTSIRNQENQEKAKKRLLVTGDNSVPHNYLINKMRTVKNSWITERFFY